MPPIRVVRPTGLKVGDCLPELPDDFDFTVQVAPCRYSHRAEVYAVLDLGGGRYPSVNRLVDLGDDGCWKRFKPFVGRGYYSSNLDYDYLLPDDVAWRHHNRTVPCVVYDKAPYTGTLRGSLR